MFFVCNRYLKLEPYEPTDRVDEVTVSSSWRNLTDTMEATLPRIIAAKGVLKVGQTMQFELGYDGNLHTVFDGYITRIAPDMPLKLYGEDAMWLLKQRSISAALRGATLKTVLATILGDVPFSCPNVSLGLFRIEKATPAQVLRDLREKYGIYSYFRDGVLHSGLPHLDGFVSRSQPDAHVFDVRRNVADANGLEYATAEDKRVKITAISLLPNNTELKVEDIGDKDGEEHTIHAYGITDKASLKDFAEAQLSRMKISGYRGGFVAFGLPFVRFGDVITLIDSDYPERGGTYQVEGVTYGFGLSKGIRQEIKLGNLVAL